MPASEWITQGLEFGKVVAPWITGGLAGAILTLLARRRDERKRRREITITSSLTSFSLPEVGGKSPLLPDELKVSYRGASFANLNLYQLEVRNTGACSISKQVVVLVLPPSVTCVGENASTSPLENDVGLSSKRVATGQERTIALPDLEPGDVVNYSLLLDGSAASSIAYYARGTDDVNIRAAGQLPNAQEMESEIRILLLLGCMYILVGIGHPFSNVLQGVVFLFMLPYLSRICLFILRNLRPTAGIAIDNLNADKDSNVSIKIFGR